MFEKLPIHPLAYNKITNDEKACFWVLLHTHKHAKIDGKQDLGRTGNAAQHAIQVASWQISSVIMIEWNFQMVQWIFDATSIFYAKKCRLRSISATREITNNDKEISAWTVARAIALQNKSSALDLLLTLDDLLLFLTVNSIFVWTGVNTVFQTMFHMQFKWYSIWIDAVFMSHFRS